MRYETSQRFERKDGLDVVIIGDIQDHFMRIAEELPSGDGYRAYVCTTGQLDDEQELGFIEQADSVSEERVAEIRDAVQ